MQFLKCLKVALILSGAAFAVTSLPAVRLANERVDIQVNRAQIFSGEMRDLSGAYLAVAGLMSMSLGVTGFSLAAWRQTGSRLNVTKQAVEELETLVKQREQQLQHAQLSPARLQRSGLNAFLEDDLFPETGAVAKQLPAAQSAPLSQIAASRVISRSEQQHSAVVTQPVKPVQGQRQLSPSQASQLQAVQAQLQQQSRQAQQTLVASRETQLHGNNGFTVINPYQVQSIAQPSRQRSVASGRRMA